MISIQHIKLLLAICVCLLITSSFKSIEEPNSNAPECPSPITGNEIQYIETKVPQKTKFNWESTISEQDLLKPTVGIPKIIHQSWKSTQLDNVFKAWSGQWKEKHPDFKYVLWTDDDNRLFIYKYYPWFLTANDMMPEDNISQSGPKSAVKNQKFPAIIQRKLTADFPRRKLAVNINHAE